MNAKQRAEPFASSSREQGARSSLARLLIVEGILIVVFAIWIGIVSAGQSGFSLRQFGGLQHALWAVSLAATRVQGPGLCSSACLFALLDFTHRVPSEAVRPRLLRAARSSCSLLR